MFSQVLTDPLTRLEGEGETLNPADNEYIAIIDSILLNTALWMSFSNTMGTCREGYHCLSCSYTGKSMK